MSCSAVCSAGRAIGLINNRRGGIDMVDGHQITTDDGQSADLAASVAESRELAILRDVLSSIEAKRSAAFDCVFKVEKGPERSARARQFKRLQKAAFELQLAIEVVEQAMVSRDGHG